MRKPGKGRTAAAAPGGVIPLPSRVRSEADARAEVEETIELYELKPGGYFWYRIGPHHSDPRQISAFQLVRVNPDGKEEILCHVRFSPL